MAAPAPLGYQPALDGVRACAVLAVMLHHADAFGLHGGGLVGVESFFVLSGFLITALMIGERAKRGGVSLRNFYARRALRLLPALFATVAAVAVYSVCFGDGRTLRAIPWVLLYVANWAQANGHPLGLLSHTWSLAIEEQFYFVWPALVVAVVARTRGYRALGAVALSLAFVSTAVRLLVWQSDASFLRLRDGFDTRAAGLLFGCALAVVLTTWHAARPLLAGWGPWLATAGAIVLAAMCGTTVNARWGYGWGLSLVQLAALALITGLIVAPTTWPARAFAISPLLWIGRRSYGLYLWHFPVFLVVARHTALSHAPTAALAMTLAFAIAATSYRFIEQPALRRKDRLAITSVGGPLPQNPEALRSRAPDRRR